jgi:hypothetical protein
MGGNRRARRIGLLGGLVGDELDAADQADPARLAHQRSGRQACGFVPGNAGGDVAYAGDDIALLIEILSVSSATAAGTGCPDQV